MKILVLGLLLFLGTHAFSMAREKRAALIRRTGEGGYKVLYSLLSLVGLALIIVGFGQYRAQGYVQLFDPPAWTRHLSMLLMLMAFISLASTWLPGRIKARLKHPMLVSVKFWALAHLLANGDLGSLLLFGLFLLWAIAARISAKGRETAPAHGEGEVTPGGYRNDALAVVLGTVAFGVFLIWLHPLLIGVPVLTPRG